MVANSLRIVLFLGHTSFVHRQLMYQIKLNFYQKALQSILPI